MQPKQKAQPQKKNKSAKVGRGRRKNESYKLDHRREKNKIKRIRQSQGWKAAMKYALDHQLLSWAEKHMRKEVRRPVPTTLLTERKTT